MTNKAWNMGIEYLQTATEGDFIDYKNRSVVVGNMCGGKFMCYENGEFVCLLQEEVRAMIFLQQGIIIR